MSRVAGAALAAMFVCFAGSARADDEQGWEKLGHKEVAHRAERDVIEVGANEGRFDKLRLSVTGNDIELFDLKVHYGNGETQDVSVRETLREGSRTRVIDLPGEARVIKRVDLVYKTEGKRREGRATVHLFGHNAGGGAREEWELLGEKQVDFKAERDVITVTAREGRFKRIVVEARENGIEVLDLDVRFGNGEKVDVNVREVLRAGTRTRVIDLPGEASVIQAIHLVYRTEYQKRREGKAHVKVFGVRVGGGEAGGDKNKGGDDDAGPAGWQLLGQKEVLFRGERDVIDVDKKDGRFRELRLHVKGNAVELFDLKVTFGNGDVQDINVRQVIEAGGWTRDIQLAGNEARFIKKIELVYRSRDQKNREGRAHIRAFGK
jgi:hypothetical protein